MISDSQNQTGLISINNAVPRFQLSDNTYELDPTKNGFGYLSKKPLIKVHMSCPCLETFCKLANIGKYGCTFGGDINNSSHC